MPFSLVSPLKEDGERERKILLLSIVIRRDTFSSCILDFISILRTYISLSLLFKLFVPIKDTHNLIIFSLSLSLMFFLWSIKESISSQI